MAKGKATSSSFKKGHARIPGAGRKKGQRNKSTELIGAFIEGIVNAPDMKAKLTKELKTLKGIYFVNAFTSLLEYVQPKLARREIVGNADQPVQHVITLELDGNGDSEDEG